jgi:hypothetical protein
LILSLALSAGIGVAHVRAAPLAVVVIPENTSHVEMIEKHSEHNLVGSIIENTLMSNGYMVLDRHALRHIDEHTEAAVLLGPGVSLVRRDSDSSRFGSVDFVIHFSVDVYESPGVTTANVSLATDNILGREATIEAATAVVAHEDETRNGVIVRAARQGAAYFISQLYQSGLTLPYAAGVRRRVILRLREGLHKDETASLQLSIDDFFKHEAPATRLNAVTARTLDYTLFGIAPKVSDSGWEIGIKNRLQQWLDDTADDYGFQPGLRAVPTRRSEEAIVIELREGEE